MCIRDRYKRYRNKKGGKGKGRRYRSTFRGRFKPVKHKRGKAHLTENDYDSWDYPAQTESQDGDDSYFGKGKPRSKGGKNKSKGRSSYGDAKGQDKGTFKASGKSKRKGGKKGKGKAHLSADAEDGAPATTAADSTSWMTNLKKHTRNIGTAADRPAGTPKIVQTGVNGLFRGAVPSSCVNTSPQK